MTPQEFLREYETSGRVGGVERTLSLIDDDAIYWFSDGGAHIGKAAIERAIRRNFEAIKDETYRLSEITWLAQTQDVAACTYRFDWSGVLHGEKASGFGRGTSVLIRKGDGWAVVHEHLSKGKTTAE